MNTTVSRLKLAPLPNNEQRAQLRYCQYANCLTDYEYYSQRFVEWQQSQHRKVRKDVLLGPLPASEMIVPFSHR